MTKATSLNGEDQRQLHEIKIQSGKEKALPGIGKENIPNEYFILGVWWGISKGICCGKVASFIDSGVLTML